MAASQEQVPTPQREKRDYPKIELGNPEEYIYVPREQVQSVLVGFGYGENMMRVHAMYLSPDGSHAVGVWQATQDNGHFVGQPVLRGVEQTEAIAQTLLVAAVLTERVPEGTSPRLTWQDVENKSTAIPPVELNTVVLFCYSGNARDLIGYGEVRLGNAILTQGYIGGVLLRQDLSERMLERIKRQQATAVNPFPLR